MSTETDVPENSFGLTNGCYIRLNSAATAEKLGMPVGYEIPIGWNGTRFRYGRFTWQLPELCAAIQAGDWEVVVGKRVDFTNKATGAVFKIRCL